MYSFPDLFAKGKSSIRFFTSLKRTLLLTTLLFSTLSVLSQESSSDFRNTSHLSFATSVEPVVRTNFLDGNVIPHDNEFSSFAPAFSGISPFSNTSVSNANVGYILSEDIASGTATFTQTGGSTDGSSPHTVSLTGNELNSGVRGQAALTNAPTLVNGAIYTISFDGTDADGNAATSASVTNVTFDNEAPTVTSIVRKTPTSEATNATSVTFTVTFSETVFLVDATDFAISGAGAGGTAAIGTVSGSGTTYDVQVNTINTAGELDLDFAGGLLIFDAAANNFAGTISSEETYTIDLTGPTVTSIARQTPTDATTSAASVTFRVTFSEDVLNVGTADFDLSGAGSGGTATITGVSTQTANTVFDVEVSTINTDGELDLDFAGGQDITDSAGNAFAGTITSEEVYTIDQTDPAFSGISPFSNKTVSNANVGYILSEDIASGTATFTRTGGTADGSSPHTVSLTGNELNSGVRGQNALTNAPTLVNGAIYTISFDGTDAAGNTANTASVTNVTFDNVAPTVTSIVRKTPTSEATNATSVTFTVTFSETVFLVDATDFAISGAGAGGTATIGTVSGSGTTYDVQVNTINSDGELDLDFAGGLLIFDAGANNFAGTITSEEVYTIDQTDPSFSGISPFSNKTVSNANVGYILSEDIASGTATFTQTGGTADGSSPHTVSLTGNELNSGVRGQSALTNAPTLVNGAIYTISFDGTDAAGNTASTASVTNVTFDNVAPTVTSFTRKTPSGESTNADQLVFLATFSEPVGLVGDDDFEVTGPTGASIAVSQITSSTYDVTISGGDLASMNGTVDLNLSGSAFIFDFAANNLTIAEPNTDETYNVDNSAPNFTSGTAVNFAENGTGTAYTAAANDDSAVTFGFGQGNDEALFNIDANSGVVTFKTAPDFENPADGGGDNTYIINVIATDGVGNAANQNVTITVTNENDNDPAFTTQPVTSIDEGQNYKYFFGTTDADGDPTTVSLTSAPSWLSISENSEKNVVSTIAGTGTGGYLDGTGTAAQFNFPWALLLMLTVICMWLMVIITE